MLTSEDVDLRLCIIVEAVHATAEGWPELRSYCIEPLLRVLAEGQEGMQRPEISLIAYHADGGTPAASLDALPWTTDVNAIRQALDELPLRFFSGGGNAGPALAEALWECLHMFSWQSNIKKRPGADEGGGADRKAAARDHALLIACTEASRATPHLPHLGQRGDPSKLSNALLDIAQMFPRRSISLTVVWPKKPESRSAGALPEVCMLGLKAAPRQPGEAGAQNGNQQQQQQPRRVVVSLPSQLSSVESWKVMVSPIAPLLKRVFDEVRLMLRPDVSNRAPGSGAAPVLAASPAATTPMQQVQPAAAAAPLQVMPTTAAPAAPAPAMPAGLNLMQQPALPLPQQAAPRPLQVRADAMALGRGGRVLAAQQQPAAPPASSATAVPYLPAPQVPQAAAQVPLPAAHASASSARAELEMVWMGGLCTVTSAGHDVPLMQVAAYQKRGSAAERPALPTRLVVEASISEKCVKQLMTSSSARSRHPRVLEARVLANTVTPDGQVVLKKLLGRQQHLIFTMPRQHVVLLFSSPSHGSLVLVPKPPAAPAAPASSAGVATESQRPGARPQAAALAPRPRPLLP